MSATTSVVIVAGSTNGTTTMFATILTMDRRPNVATRSGVVMPVAVKDISASAAPERRKPLVGKNGSMMWLMTGTP